jgi:subtilisin family serine protease
MSRRIGPFWNRKTRSSLCLFVAAVVLALVVPLTVFAATTQGGVAKSEGWAKAPAWAAALWGDSAAPARGEVIVEFAQGTKRQAMLQTASASGITLKRAHAGTGGKTMSFAVYKSATLTTAQLVARLKNQPGVVAVEPNSPLRLSGTYASAESLQTATEGFPAPNDPSFGSQWALENTGQVAGTVDADIDALTAWQRTTGSADVVVAVIDSGVDYEHADLAANMWKNPGEREQPYDGIDNDSNGYVDDVYGVDVANGDGDPFDDDSNGHGTHVAGVIAAAGGNEVGTAGVSWRAKIMALKAFDASGWSDESLVIDCINYAIEQKVNHGVNVVAINASFEGTSYNQLLRTAIQNAGTAGIIFVAAAGNGRNGSGLNLESTPVYPASYNCSNIIAVGASTTYDARAGWSNCGATSVDLFAPGVGILSTVPPYQAAGTGPGTLFFDDMESGAGNWGQVAGDLTGTWAITTEANLGAGGSHSWSDSPSADYPKSSRYVLTTRTIDLSSAVTSGAWLGFSVLHDFAVGDCLITKVSGNNGSSYEGVHLFTGTGAQDYWVKLPASVVTSTFKLQFVLETACLTGHTSTMSA